MIKKYYCLCENSITIQNECELNTLKEVQEFLTDLGNYTLTINDFDNLIQIGKIEKYINNERFLILVKES